MYPTAGIPGSKYLVGWKMFEQIKLVISYTKWTGGGNYTFVEIPMSYV